MVEPGEAWVRATYFSHSNAPNVSSGCHLRSINLWSAHTQPLNLNQWDPEDKTLHKVESEVSIPQKMKKKAKEKCQEVVQGFENFAKESGLLLPFKCRPQAKSLERCLIGWYENEDFKEQCKQEYLEERSEYRRTGIRQKTKRKESTML